MWHTGYRGGCMYVNTGNIWDISLPSAHLCCQSKAALNKVYPVNIHIDIVWLLSQTIFLSQKRRVDYYTEQQQYLEDQHSCGVSRSHCPHRATWRDSDDSSEGSRLGCGRRTLTLGNLNILSRLIDMLALSSAGRHSLIVC